ncbi:hypothetical protein HOH45_04830 [bacterium]|nr:hypothetical protein [bacterium]
MVNKKRTDGRNRCQKIKKDKKQCNGISVTGKNNCRMHGGKGGRPIIHGQYSKYHLGTLKQHRENSKNDQTNKDWVEEIKLLRVQLQELLLDNSMDVLTKANAIRKLVNSIGKSCHKLHKHQIKAGKYIHDKALRAILTQMINILVKYVPDQELRERMSVEVKKIKVPKELQG